MDGFELEFEKEAIGYVANKALELKTGARGIRTIMETRMTELMYDLPDPKVYEKVIITKDFMEKGAEPKLIRRVETEPKESVG